MAGWRHAKKAIAIKATGITRAAEILETPACRCIGDDFSREDILAGGGGFGGLGGRTWGGGL